jgi:hypothetical protein
VEILCYAAFESECAPAGRPGAGFLELGAKLEEYAACVEEVCIASEWTHLPFAEASSFLLNASHCVRPNAHIIQTRLQLPPQASVKSASDKKNCILIISPLSGKASLLQPFQ